MNPTFKSIHIGQCIWCGTDTMSYYYDETSESDRPVDFNTKWYYCSECNSIVTQIWQWWVDNQLDFIEEQTLIGVIKHFRGVTCT